MTKKILSIVLLLVISMAKGQSYLGFYHDNYSGVQSVLFNPASIVDSRFKTDINLVSGSVAVNNDIYGVKFLDILRDQYDFENQAKRTLNNNNQFNINIDVMGPSFMFNIKPKHSLALFSRLRGVANLIDVNGVVVNELEKENKNSFNYNLGSPNFVENTWGELGVSYATVLLQRDQHFLKAGLSVKYLQGLENIYFKGNDINFQYQESVISPQNSIYTTSGSASFGRGEDAFKDDERILNSKSFGFGFDLGFVYEWRPEFQSSRSDINDLKYLNKYKIRVGLSLTDFGKMNYDKATREIYNLNQTVTRNELEDVENEDDFDYLLENNYSGTLVNGTFKAKLPTAVHADIDWNFYKKFYLNLNGDFGVVSRSALNQNSIQNRISLTPRYESRWFSFSLPISYMDVVKQEQIGVGLRTGILFVGSSSIISNLYSNNSRGADVYVGVKIPVYQKKLKDKDEDGVLDKNDECPEIAGPLENNGCPFKDSDGDKVLDKDDKCPTIAGPEKNKGCPWSDSDGDNVLDKDDKCPDVKGPASNNGCPILDTDGDGVLDKEDKCPTITGLAALAGCPDSDKDGLGDNDDACPTVAGSLANKGCPELNAAVIKKLNEYSKSVLFDSGAATVKAESFAKLEEIAKVMMDYNSSNFKLEGYTDNTGNVLKNLKLSKDRAAAIKNYLITKGINANRLSSDGYGIKKPIASNKTLAGRAQNRRVEIVLVN